MSRRPSLPGAAELFRATGGAGQADPAPREPERPVGRLRPAQPEPTEPEHERTASVRTLAGAVTGADPVVAPVRLAEPSPQPAGRPATSAESSRDAGFDDATAARRGQRSSGVRQTRRQRVRTVGDRRPSGRERHEEKITVYCSAEELLDLESARLALRGEHGLVVDRGRIVREAVAVVLADLEAKGDESILVRRLREL